MFRFALFSSQLGCFYVLVLLLVLRLGLRRLRWQPDYSDWQRQARQARQARRARRARRARQARQAGTTPVPTTPTPTSVCSTITSWHDSRLSKCDFWGDPHFKNSFFGSHFDYQGVGAFEVAASDDGSFRIQDFQCSFAHGGNAVVIGVAIKVQQTPPISG